MSSARFGTPRWTIPLALLVGAAALNACALNITRYTDGPMTQYLNQPLPGLDAPIARTLSLERVTYNTASSDKGTMISDLTAREIYILPGSVGREVDALLELDEAFDPDDTLAALNKIAQRRSEARIAGGMGKLGSAKTSDVTGASAQYIARQESLAADAYAKGDYLGGNIHSSAAETSLRTTQAAERTQATAGVVFAVMGAASAAGEAMIKSEFNTLRDWIETGSGAIGEQAPTGTHLSVFLLSYFDAKRFKLDSRNRIAVYLVLTEETGEMKAVLEGSDILVCQAECDLFEPKPTAQYYDETAPSNEVQKMVSTHDGIKKLQAMGFTGPGGNYQYVLLRQGLQKLSAMNH